jgi:hypothetical protein
MEWRDVVGGIRMHLACPFGNIFRSTLLYDKKPSKHDQRTCSRRIHWNSELPKLARNAARGSRTIIARTQNMIVIALLAALSASIVLEQQEDRMQQGFAIKKLE